MASRRVPRAKLPIPRHVVEHLHQIRIARSLSYDTLAAELELSRIHLFRLMTLRGQRTKDTTLAKINRYLDTQAPREERVSA